MMNKNYLLLAVLAATIGGCQKQASNYCDDAPFHNCQDQVDAPIDAAACSSNANCTAPLGVCDVTGSKTCVECTATDHAACVGVEPVCGADQTCHACKAHSECTSEVCLPDGSCATEGDVAYVNGNAGAGSACTKTAPCKTLTAAAATTKAIVKVTGIVKEASVSFTGSVARKVFGDAGAKIEGTSGTQNLLELRDTTNLELFDLTVGGTAGSKPSACIALIAGTPSVRVTRGRVENCQMGISSIGGTVSVTGATVVGNIGGGISLTGSVFKLTNNFIVGNGSGTSAVGGIQISNITQAGTYECAFNSVYNNDAIPSAITGIGCQTVGVPLSFKNNIVYANKVSAGGTQVGGSPMCQHTYSDIGPDTATGTGNINADPQFVNVAQLNIHIQSTSPAKDAADPAATIATDIDGDSRPQGTGRDIGADEYKP